MAIIAQLVRAPDCGSGGRGFESRCSPIFTYISALLLNTVTHLLAVRQRFDPLLKKFNLKVISIHLLNSSYGAQQKKK